jgi:hypothetical protein
VYSKKFGTPLPPPRGRRGIGIASSRAGNEIFAQVEHRLGALSLSMSFSSAATEDKSMANKVNRESSKSTKGLYKLSESRSCLDSVLFGFSILADLSALFNHCLCNADEKPLDIYTSLPFNSWWMESCNTQGVQGFDSS